ncbi:MAG: type I-F CRISPR-associated protein Csy1 [Desulfomicrobium sp.]
MNQSDLEMSNGLHKIMVDFLIARRDAKLEKLKPDDPKREELHTQYELQTWLADAARRASQIQGATHTLKAIHPDARGANLYCAPSTLPDCRLVGSHLLGNKFCTDVIGNAAALDVNKFLTQVYQDKTLLAWMLDNEEVVIAAFQVEDADIARQWVRAFLGLIRSPDKYSSHSLAKQLYWMVGDDPGDDAQFHLLAPLYASSLAHSVYTPVQEHRFGDETKAAREAKKQNAFCEHALHEYPNIAVQKMGGSKPQNISQLNSERKGVSYLLSSCPPHWRSLPTKPPYGVSSLFERFGRQKDIKVITRELRGFLESNPESNRSTRDHRDDMIDRILIKLLQHIEKIRALPPGWSADTRCRLVEAEQCWLDPKRATLDAEFAATWLRLDWPEEIKSRFGNWLNAMLSGKLPLGDNEHAYWADFFDDEEWRRQVKSDRRDLEEGGAYV